MKEQNHVDTTETTSCLEWCAGYGGISLGLKRAIPSLRTIAFGEIEAFACANLVSKMEAGLLDAAPIWTDIKTFPCESFRDCVDIFVAGYPCQPFSAAGKRLGAEDQRHLWPHIARAISIIRPRLCFFENVEGHISLGLSTVISDLEELGYKVSWGIFSASEVGAPHQRKRVFILAHRINERLERLVWNVTNRCKPERNATQESGSVSESNFCVWPSRPGEPQHGWEPPRVVHSNNNRFIANVSTDEAEQDRNGQDDRLSCAASAMGGSDAAERTEAQPALGRDADGTAGGMGYAELYVSCDNRTDELRLLGNGVVPATAERAFRVLIEELNE